MKKVLLIVVLLNIFSIYNSAQKPANTPIKKAKPSPTPTTAVTEISEPEWKILAKSLEAEDWTKAAETAAIYLKKLKTDNDKKQAAQLRYLHLYALSGKILAVSGTNIPADTDKLWSDLNAATSEYNGKEIILPPRQFQNDCQKRVNYICRVADNDRALRVTATNKGATAILSFDYIIFDDKNSLNSLPETQLFLGGILTRIEYNQDASSPWVMRLFFEKAFAGLASK